MKTLTLIQPWATLIALEEKTIETRSWPTNYRGPLAIHAGKKVDKNVFNLPFYKEVFERYQITPDNIITSAIICTCDLTDVERTENIRSRITEKEMTFGNYNDNRYGWILKNVTPIAPIRPVKGMLGLWNYDVPQSSQMAYENKAAGITSKEKD